MLSTCNDPTCAVALEGKVAVCPKCGGPMRRVGESPVRGWILVVLGAFLILFMGAIMLTLAPTMLNPGETIDGSSFTGTAEQARMAMLLFGAVTLLGFVAFANGIYMLRTKRQSKGFVVATLALAAVLVVIVWTIMGWDAKR
jgi:uncharacterized membrane protein